MKSKAVVPFLCSLLVLSSCQSDLGVDPIEQELQKYKVLFARNITELNAPGGTDRRIYVMNADGQGLLDLSQHPDNGYPGIGKGWDSGPEFSPNGQSIAFQTIREGNQDIYVMQSDGSNKTNITRSSELDLEFDWSPDGGTIVFTRLVQERYVLYTIAPHGAGLNRLTSLNDNCRYPAWSPDGSKIAFSRLIPGSSRREIVVMNSDGSNTRSISNSTQSALFPQWSTNGMRVYYMVQLEGLRVSSLDGTFDAGVPGFYPQRIAWSPDGQQFVTSDSVSLAIITADLSSVKRLNAGGFEPRWSPDGSWILFQGRNMEGITELRVVRPDGSDDHRLTSSPFGDLFASWRPL